MGQPREILISDRKSTRLNSSHLVISYAVFCLKKIAATDMSDRFGWQIQEHPKALLPLIEQLLPVNDYQSVDLAFRDQPRRNGGLSERCRRAEDTFVVCGDLRDRFLLER